MTPFKKVPKNIGMNPVGRAVALANFRRQVTTLLMAFYVMEEGEDCMEWVDLAMQVCVVVAQALDIQGREDSPEAKAILDGMIRMSEIAERGFTWRKADSAVLDQAVDVAVHEYAKIPAKVFNEAWLSINRAAPK